MLKSLICLILIPTCIFAHALKLFVTKNPESLHVKAYFSKSSPCIECETIVYDIDKNILLKAITDKKGEVNIPHLAKNMSILVKTSMGHQTEKNIEIATFKKEEMSYPAWLKIVLALSIISGFFGGLYYVKRESK